MTASSYGPSMHVQDLRGTPGDLDIDRGVELAVLFETASLLAARLPLPPASCRRRLPLLSAPTATTYPHNRQHQNPSSTTTSPSQTPSATALPLATTLRHHYHSVASVTASTGIPPSPISPHEHPHLRRSTSRSSGHTTRRRRDSGEEEGSVSVSVQLILVTCVRRIRTGSGFQLRVCLTFVTNPQRSTPFGAGLSHMDAGYALKRVPRCGFVSRVRRMCTESCLQCLFDACVRRIRTEAGDCLSICRHCFDQRDLFLPTSQLSAKTSCTPTETLPRRKEHGCAPSWQTIYIRYDSAFSATAHGRE